MREARKWAVWCPEELKSSILLKPSLVQYVLFMLSSAALCQADWLLGWLNHELTGWTDETLIDWLDDLMASRLTDWCVMHDSKLGAPVCLTLTHSEKRCLFASDAVCQSYRHRRLQTALFFLLRSASFQHNTFSTSLCVLVQVSLSSLFKLKLQLLSLCVKLQFTSVPVQTPWKYGVRTLIKGIKRNSPWNESFQCMEFPSEKHAVFTQRLFLQRSREDWWSNDSHLKIKISRANELCWTVMLHILMLLQRRDEFNNTDASHTHWSPQHFEGGHPGLVSSLQYLTKRKSDHVIIMARTCYDDTVETDLWSCGHKVLLRDINVTSQWPSTTKKWTFVQNSEKSPQNTQEIVLTRIGHTHEQAAVINAHE